MNSRIANLRADFCSSGTGLSTEIIAKFDQQQMTLAIFCTLLVQIVQKTTSRHRGGIFVEAIQTFMAVRGAKGVAQIVVSSLITRGKNFFNKFLSGSFWGKSDRSR